MSAAGKAKKKPLGKFDCEIRSADNSDALKIHRLLSLYAGRKLLLPRSAKEIKDNISMFKVAVSGRRMAGCCAVKDYGNGLYEIRSLAVSPSLNGRGLGSRLVKSWMRTLKRKGARRIFALTYRPGIFVRMGFNVVKKESFPEKIWSDCEQCSKKKSCDETAVLLRVDG